jgi:hypothetical protein
LWRKSGEIAFMWRHHYGLSPLDERYLDMTESAMAEDLLQHLYLSARSRQADPTDPVGNEMRARSSGAQQFLEELKANRATYDAMAARYMRSKEPVKHRTVVKVITNPPEPRK